MREVEVVTEVPSSSPVKSASTSFTAAAPSRRLPCSGVDDKWVRLTGRSHVLVTVLL